MAEKYVILVDLNRMVSTTHSALNHASIEANRLLNDYFNKFEGEFYVEVKVIDLKSGICSFKSSISPKELDSSGTFTG